MTKVSCLLSLAAILAILPAGYGQTPTEDAATRAVYREEKSIILRQTLTTAKAIEQRGDIKGAAKSFGEALNLADELGSNVEAEKVIAQQGVVRTRLALAIAASKQNEFREAELEVKQALRADPNNLQAINFEKENAKRLKELEGKLPSQEVVDLQPASRTNKLAASTLVRDGKLLMDMGKFEDAEAKLTLALKKDPDNEGAHYYLNIIRERNYTRAAKVHEVGVKDSLIEIEKKWFRPESKLPVANAFARTNLIYTGRGRQNIQRKLQSIVIDELKLPGIPLLEVVKLLNEESKKRDPDHIGVNIFISSQIDQAAPQAQQFAIDPNTGQPVPAQAPEPVNLGEIQIRIDPPINHITLGEALDAVTKAADKPIKFSMEDYAILFTQRLPEAVQLYSRTFRVDPDTFVQGLESVVGLPIGQLIQGGQGGGQQGGGGQNGQGGGLYSVPRVSVAQDSTGGQGGGGGGGGGANGQGIGIAGVTRTNNMAFVQILVKQFFAAAGVNFPINAAGLGGIGGGGGGFGGGFGGNAAFGGAGGAGGLNDPNADQKALFFNDRTGLLFVRATLSDLDIIEKAIQALNQAPPQVQIEARFAEVNQTDTKALGFDWYLGNFLLGGGKVGLTGGSAPSIQGRPSAANPGSSVVDASGNVISSLPGGVFPGTSVDTLRGSSTTDQTVTSGLRNKGSDGTSIPAIATVTGILTDPQFRAVIKALDQRDGVDLLSAPKVTTLSGRQAQIQVSDVRTIAVGLGTQGGQNGGGNAGTAGTGTAGVGQTFTPLASAYIPTTTAVPFGPTLDVIPYVTSDDVSIKLTLIPSYVEFVGYDDPGEFVPQIIVASGANIATRTAVLPLPRLRIRQVATTAIVWDGMTIALGGLIAEDSAKQRDKVPGLGDLPLIGRLFRSEYSRVSKKNLIIFVTPTIIDPAGKRIHDPNNLPFDPKSLPTPSVIGQ
ncbi:MAG TPA: hypothetical protein VMF06_05035 [Candidatus Limnocylindria bacterium]|nr:hypothetical protein [Candidatus Limnocylindria bacterium]